MVFKTLTFWGILICLTNYVMWQSKTFKFLKDDEDIHVDEIQLFDTREKWSQWINKIQDFQDQSGDLVIPPQILSERHWIASKYRYRIELSIQEIVDWATGDSWQYLSSIGVMRNNLKT